MELGHLKGSGILPLGVPIALIKLDGMVVILWDFITILVVWRCAVRPELGLVNHAKELLVAFGNALEPFPTIKIKKAIFLGINCAGDRVVSGNEGEGLRGNLPIFPFNHDVVLGTLVTWV